MKTTTTLFFRDGNSDKVYVATLDNKKVTLTWGRRRPGWERGTGMQEQVLNLGSAEAAEKEYSKRVNEKLRKGYSPDLNAQPAAAPAVSEQNVAALMDKLRAGGN